MNKKLIGSILVYVSFIGINIQSIYADNNVNTENKKTEKNDIKKDTITPSKVIKFDNQIQDSLDQPKKDDSNKNSVSQDNSVTPSTSSSSNSNDKQALTGTDSSSSSSESVQSLLNSTATNDNASSSVSNTDTSTVKATPVASTSISKADVSSAFEKLAKEFNLSDTDKENWKFIIQKESGFNTSANNASSGAYGLGQALPGSKMAVYGSDWQTNPEVQLRWMYNYMNERYGSINNAYNYWLAHKWY